MQLTNAETDILARAIRSYNTRAFGKNTITGLGTVQTLAGSGTIPGGTVRAIVDVEGQAVRYWIDGSTPTSAQGHLANAGDQIQIENGFEVTNFKATEAGTPGATLQVTFFGGGSV